MKLSTIKFHFHVQRHRMKKRIRRTLYRSVCFVVGHKWFNSTSWSGVSKTCKRCSKFWMIRRSTVIRSGGVNF